MLEIKLEIILEAEIQIIQLHQETLQEIVLEIHQEIQQEINSKMKRDDLIVSF